MSERSRVTARNVIHGGPSATSYESYSVHCKTGALIAAGEQSSDTCIISLDTLPINGLSLLQGGTPLGPKVALNQKGIQLAVGGPTGARIELTSTGLTLAFGPEGTGPSIGLTASGITLKMGATNQIELSNTKISVDALQMALQAVTSMQVQAVELTETVSGPVSRTGAVTTLT